MNDILRVNNLAKRYPSFSLEGITLDLPAGYIMGLIGENGAGKTTLIRTILGMVQADEGTVELLGRPVDKEVLSQVGVVFDQSHLVEEWKVAEAEKALMAFYPQWDRETFRRCLERFAISPGKKVKELSRGMQTKLSLSMALSHQARLLILDEPTSGLDPASRDELMELLAVQALQAIIERYGVTIPEESDFLGYDLLQQAGRRRGFLQRGGEIDTERMAHILLDEFRGGVLGRITLERVDSVD